MALTNLPTKIDNTKNGTIFFKNTSRDHTKNENKNQTEAMLILVSLN